MIQTFKTDTPARILILNSNEKGESYLKYSYTSKEEDKGWGEKVQGSVIVGYLVNILSTILQSFYFNVLDHQLRLNCSINSSLLLKLEDEYITDPCVKEPHNSTKRLCQKSNLIVRKNQQISSGSCLVTLPNISTYFILGVKDPRMLDRLSYLFVRLLRFRSG